MSDDGSTEIVLGILFTILGVATLILPVPIICIGALIFGPILLISGLAKSARGGRRAAYPRMYYAPPAYPYPPQPVAPPPAAPPGGAPAVPGPVSPPGSATSGATRTCPKCGRVSTGAKFCPSCGLAFGG